jgi:ubiquinone/menaquinone biosynthesis C-methylase UbiE
VYRAGFTNVHLCRSATTQLPFRDGTFAGVTASFALHELPPPEREAALDELARVAAPGAIAAVLDYGRPSGVVRPLLLASFLRVFEHERVRREFLDYDVVAALRRRGFGDLGVHHGRLAWRIVVGRKQRAPTA